MHRREGRQTIRVVLFDVGGVLVRLEGVATVRGWAGLTEAQFWQAWLCSPAVRDFETGRIDVDTFASRAVRELGLPVTPDLFLSSYVRWPVGLYPGVRELLSQIPSTYTRALLSNGNALHWPRIAHDLGLGEFFEHQFISHLTGRLKPDPDAFVHVIDALGCEPAEVFFLDDNGMNVDAARRVGMRASVVKGARGAARVLGQAGITDTGSP